MAIDNAGLWALEHARLGADIGFEATGLLLAQKPNGRSQWPLLSIGISVHGSAVLGDPLEGRQLGRVLRHDPLAGAAVGDAPLRAEGVQGVAAPDAEARLQRPPPVVQPRVDHLAVARRRLRPHLPVPLYEDRGILRGG